MIATRFLSDIISQLCLSRQNSIRFNREIDDYESVTWTLLLASTKFFPSHRTQNDQQMLLANPVTHKYAKQTCVWIPKAKIRMDK